MFSRFYSLLWSYLASSSFILSGQSFNIDTTNPIIISDHFDGSDSFFGTSVTLLKRDEESTSPDASSWVIVGAPKANSTHKKHQTIFEPGVVWRCSLGRSQDFCEVLVMDPTENRFFQQDDLEGNIFDRKDGGWLGGSMFSNNGEKNRFVSCANRWQNQLLYMKSDFEQHYQMNGICYWRPTKDIQVPGPVPDLPPEYRLFPLRNIDEQARTESQFDWVFGQSGFSLHVTDDNQMIIGAPGMYNWRGGVIQFYDKKPASLKRNGQPDEFGGIFEKVVVSMSELNPELNSTDSYLGYAVSAGKFFRAPANKPSTQFVAGAPRGHSLFGKIVVFNFPAKGSKLSILQEIRGGKVGTYFGSVLCSVDVNNDGFDDLLVGAPQFTTKLNPRFVPFRVADPNEPETMALMAKAPIIKPADFGDEGRVFVYLSNGIQLSESGQLNGGNAVGARFGSSISSIGDINNDGYNDIAIGAPFENEESGVVYIYHGGSDGFQTKASQIIKGKDLHASLRGFGYSLSAGVDIDENGYNDLAVGSFISAQTVILRTRPIVKLKSDITTKIEKLSLNATDFKFKVCVSYTGRHAPAKLNMDIKLTMDSDNKPPRANIQMPDNSMSLTRTHSFRNVHYDLPSCETMTGIVSHKLSVSGNPIVIKSEITLEKDVKARDPTIYSLSLYSDNIPRLDSSGPTYQKFCRDCPFQDEESKDERRFYLALELPCGSDNKCISELRLSAAFLEISPGNGFIVGSKSTVILNINMTNFGEAALSPSIRIESKQFALQRIPPNCQQEKPSMSNYICRFGEMLTTNTLTNQTLEFDTKDLYVNDKENNKLDITLTAGTASDMLSPVSLVMAAPLIFDGDFFMTAKDTTLQLSGEAVNPFQFFTHSYEVGLDGISSLETIKLDFNVPVRLIGFGNEPIVEITNLRAFLDGEIMDCTRFQALAGSIPKSQVNNDSEIIPFTTNLEQQSRKDLQRIEVEDLNNAPPLQDKKPKTPPKNKLAKNGVFIMECSADYVECEKFECNMHKFKPGYQASIDFSLKVMTKDIQKLLKEQNAEEFQVKSSGTSKISIYSGYIPPKNQKADEASAITRIKLDSAAVSKWVYAASISGGFICLAILVFCFYMCGCFERKKKPMEEEEKEANETTEAQRLHQPQSQEATDDDSGDEENNERRTGDYSREETVSPPPLEGNGQYRSFNGYGR